MYYTPFRLSRKAAINVVKPPMV